MLSANKQHLTFKLLKSNYFHVFLISVSDDDFFANVGKVPLPTISPSGENTKDIKDVQTFVDKFMEGTVSITKFKEYLENNTDWSEWKFSVQIKVSEEKPEGSKTIEKSKMIAAEINLIQAAVIKKDVAKVKIITKMAQDKNLGMENLLESKIKCHGGGGIRLNQKMSWILNATVIHLAAHWHVESLSHFLQIKPELCNIRTEGSLFTPLHVAASVENGMDAISLLLQRDADTEIKDKAGQTPLHVAAQCESINNIVALLFEGNANITALDNSKLSVLHKAKTSKILDILLSKANAKMLTDFNDKLDEGDCLFTHILNNQPDSIETYLDLMITSNNPDSNINNKQFTFHMDMFNHGTSEKENYLEKHQKIIKAGYLEMLRHPVMMFFTTLKWYPHKKLYYANFILFLVFLISFNVHGICWIDYLQCLNKQNVLKISDETSGNGELIKNSKKLKEQLIITSFLGQLWKLDGSTLINKADIWHSSDEWNFLVKGDFIIIENTSNKKVLGIKNNDEVSMKDFANNAAEQLWEKEETEKEGFFVLKSSKSNKVLSAKVKSKYRIHALYVHVLEDY